MSIKPWKTLSTRPIYENPWIRVREDIAELPNGRTSIYGVVSTGKAVGVLPFLDDKHVLLVRQFRYVFGEAHRWEIPTGGMHEHETPEQAALRELQEEVGHTAGKLDWLSTCYSSKSILHEVAYLFLGTHLTASTLPPDDTEFLEVGVFPFAEAMEMVRNSEIRDALSVIAVLHAATRMLDQR